MNETKVSRMNYSFQKVLPAVYDDSLTYYESVCKLVAKINEMVDAINNISVDILDDAKTYTDSAVQLFDDKVQASIKEVYNVREQLYNLSDELNKQYNDFVRLTQSQLLLFDNRLNDVHTRIDDVTISINKRTDEAIKQNNEILLTDLGRTLSQVKVLNYFTGEYVAIQEMFNYMCLLHVDDSLVYDELISKNITFNRLASLDMKYTDMILHGNTIII